MAYKIRELDIAWFNQIFNALKVGGIWVAPMGFSFKKVGSKRMELLTVTANSLEETGLILETLGITQEVAARVGVEVIIDGMAESITLALLTEEGKK